MKKKTGNSIKLGIFVTVAAGLLITGIYLIGRRQQLFNSTFLLSCTFRDVNGLQPGNNVRFSGINVGTVTDVEIVSDTSVRVDMVIDEHTRKFIKKDAKAVIGSDGLMGNKLLIIVPGTVTEKIVENHDMISSAQPVTIDDIMVRLKTTTENTSEITGHLNAIAKNIHEGRGTIGKLFMDSLLAHNLDQSIANIKEGAGGFKQNMDAAKNSFLLRGLFRNKSKEKNSNLEKKDTKDKTNSNDQKNKTAEPDKKNEKKGFFKRKLFSR